MKDDNGNRTGSLGISGGDSINSLRDLVSSLLDQPPESTQDLQRRYDDIRGLVKTIEASRNRQQLLSDLLESLDDDFERARRIYPYLSPRFLDQVGTSVFANEYRFFVGALEGYLAKLGESPKRSPLYALDLAFR